MFQIFIIFRQSSKALYHRQRRDTDSFETDEENNVTGHETDHDRPKATDDAINEIRKPTTISGKYKKLCYSSHKFVEKQTKITDCEYTNKNPVEIILIICN